MRSERSGRRTFHTPLRWWQHEAAVGLEGLRLGETHESHCWARSGEAFLRLRGGSQWEVGWRVRGAGPGATRSDPQLLWVSMDTAETTSTAREHRDKEWHPCLVKPHSFFSRERRGALFQRLHGRPTQVYVGLYTGYTLTLHLPLPVRARPLRCGSSSSLLSLSILTSHPLDPYY